MSSSLDEKGTQLSPEAEICIPLTLLKFVKQCLIFPHTVMFVRVLLHKVIETGFT